jgi:hypothetical protein
MLRVFHLGAAALLLGALLPAATLERLSLDELAGKSTAIVRARVTTSYTAASGSIVYTHYRVAVTERWKGADAAQLELVVPGGTVGRARQTFAGAPVLVAGHEYVLFLWTGRSGLTHILGLSQGVFDVATAPDGEVEVTRAAAGGLMLDNAGNPVRDQSLKLRLSDLRVRVNRVVAKGAGQ